MNDDSLYSEMLELAQKGNISAAIPVTLRTGEKTVYFLAAHFEQQPTNDGEALIQAVSVIQAAHKAAHKEI